MPATAMYWVLQLGPLIDVSQQQRTHPPVLVGSCLPSALPGTQPPLAAASTAAPVRTVTL
jgi:hypothetical protein